MTAATRNSFSEPLRCSRVKFIGYFLSIPRDRLVDRVYPIPAVIPPSESLRTGLVSSPNPAHGSQRFLSEPAGSITSTAQHSSGSSGVREKPHQPASIIVSGDLLLRPKVQRRIRVSTRAVRNGKLDPRVRGGQTSKADREHSTEVPLGLGKNRRSSPSLICRWQFKERG